MNEKLILHNATLNWFDDSQVKKISAKNIVIYTKKNSLKFVFDYRLDGLFIPQMDYRKGILLRMREEITGQLDYFLIVPIYELTKYGVHQTVFFVTNQVYNAKPSIHAIRQYNREMDKPQITKPEHKYIDKAMDALKFYTSEYEVKRVDAVKDYMRIKLSDLRDAKKYREFVGDGLKRPFLKPDIEMIEHYYGRERIYFVEVEHTRHKPADFLKKLLKIHMLRRRIYFVFNGALNEEYHLEYIYEFQKLTGRKFDRYHPLLYTTLEKLEKNGMDAFTKWT